MLGSFVRAYRKSIGKTLADVSADSGLTINQLHKLERGTANLATLHAVSEAIGLEWVGGLADGPTLGARIKRERLKHGLNAKEAAGLAGISFAALIRVELDRAHIATAEKVLRVLAPKIRARVLRHKQPIRIRDIRLTAPDFIEQVREVMGGIDCDPCAHPASFVRAKTNFYEHDDGLSQEWTGRCFVNPPYSSWGLWVRKAHAEWRSGRATQVIMLLPSRTGDRAFQELSSEVHVIFLKGRMLFWNENGTPCDFRAPFPPMILIFSAENRLIERAKQVWNGIHVPVARSSLRRSDAPVEDGAAYMEPVCTPPQ